MGKVFCYYDNDDDGSISYDNIWQAADLLDLENELNEQNVNMMIEMGDPSNKGFVEKDGFISLMREIGLIPEIEEKDLTDKKIEQRKLEFERAVK